MTNILLNILREGEGGRIISIKNTQSKIMTSDETSYDILAEINNQYCK